MSILTVNAGSSSLKLRLLDDDDTVERSCDVPVDAGQVDAGALADVVAEWPRPVGVGHRVVHGGSRLTGPVVVDAEIRHELEALTELAPLHQPRALAALDVVSRALPDVPAVACFDTAFHRTIPAVASTYALPAAWRSTWPIKRYGFHGLSHADASRAAPRLIGREAADLRTVVCHLGAGGSLCAVDGGRSVDTTMGFTPLEGLMMATRSGSVDPGLLVWLLHNDRMSLDTLVDGLESHAGMLGLAGTADIREAVERALRGDQAAVLGLDVYVRRLAAGIAAMAVSLGGLDLLVFTGGVGEGSVEVRQRAVAALAFLGLRLDPAKNASVTEGDVAAAGSTASVVVVRSREDRQMAAEVRTVVSGAS